MSEKLRIWKGTGYNKEVTLQEHKYSDGSIHYTFRDRFGHPGNPTEEEAQMIIRRWNLKEV